MRNVNPSILTYLGIRNTYFGETPTNLTIGELKTKLLMEHDTIPLIEMAFILQLVEKDYLQMVEAAKKSIGRNTFQTSTPSYVQVAPVRLSKHYH